ncbi:cytochrome c oxidase assembly protein COX16-domain-containing protein [Protomyces lactucae-debilis]|uniref:Cytochrome c oxidase assembly protein COX16, mitochondrial n=1 Tax=Protomyces lactucae-debilis TaxID=2754530 RepID=A0A1Y2FSW2_PROLT|nr:cytochrome c oxidase assembly protein COX16-domain-containing protein [Protomyces lactucae-debilis]ORY87093.1 cytochrome c oxidase assembly protein COX16-domain-containing protein [Protomyces lactucae-debilis]
MPTFNSKTYVRPGHRPPASVRLNKRISRHPVALFGVPFVLTILGGAYVLTSSQQVRYERKDSKVKLVSEEEALGLEHGRRKVSAKDEWYRLQAKGLDDLDDWENKRVERLPHEADNVLAVQGK